MKKNFLIFLTIFSFFSFETLADLNSDINDLFAQIQSSFQDSNYAAVNAILIPYKKSPDQMKLILSATKTINSITNTTPLHVAVQGDNLGITALIFQKASYVGKDQYPVFSRQLANALDGNNKKPINYTNDPDIISFLSNFTDP